MVYALWRVQYIHRLNKNVIMMCNINLFSAFEALSTSCCLSLGCIARYASSLRTAICSTTEVSDQRGANPFKIARNKFIEPTL